MYKNVKNLIKSWLVKSPKARERRYKNRLIAHLILQENRQLFNGNEEYIKEKLEQIVGFSLTADRAWRQVTEKNKELRGSDYKDKVKLEEKRLKELNK